MKIKQISTKIQAYELAWVIINSGLFRGGRELVQEAWHIVKTLSPARGKSKVGRAAKFRRIYGATPTNPRGLELEKLNSKTANWFVEYAKRELDIKRATK